MQDFLSSFQAQSFWVKLATYLSLIFIFSIFYWTFITPPNSKASPAAQELSNTETDGVDQKKQLRFDLKHLADTIQNALQKHPRPPMLEDGNITDHETRHTLLDRELAPAWNKWVSVRAVLKANQYMVLPVDIEEMNKPVNDFGWQRLAEFCILAHETLNSQ